MISPVQILKEKKIKVTPARVKILELFSRGCKPLNVEGIAKAIKHTDEVTIYRTLATFEKAGIIKQIDLRKGSVFYELHNHHHHHIICTRCGDIEGFELCAVPKISQEVLKTSKKFKSISEHSLELFGVCKACIKK